MFRQSPGLVKTLIVAARCRTASTPPNSPPLEWTGEPPKSAKASRPTPGPADKRGQQANCPWAEREALRAPVLRGRASRPIDDASEG